VRQGGDQPASGVQEVDRPAEQGLHGPRRITQNGVVVGTPHPRQGHQQVSPLGFPPRQRRKKCSSLSSAARSGSPAMGVRVAAVASARARTASTPITGRSGVGSTPAPLIRQGFRPSRSIARALDGWREQARTQKMILGCNVVGADMDGKMVSRTPGALISNPPSTRGRSLAGSHHGC
jgi:hypothetical protein